MTIKRDPVKLRAMQDRARAKQIEKRIAKQRAARADKKQNPKAGVHRKPKGPGSSAQRRKQRALDIDRRQRLRRAVVRRDGNVCYAKSAGLAPEVRCSSPFASRATLEMHEVVKRSRWAAGAFEVSNVRLLCQAHHDWTEAEPAAATAVGLLATMHLPRGRVERAT